MEIFDEQEFDIDNRDIEEEMYNSELEQEEIENLENAENAEIEENIKNAEKLGKVLNKKNLDIDLANKCENTRNIYKFKKDGILYSGYVIYKFNKDEYIFCIEDKTSETGKKSKKFNINEIKQEK